MASAGNDRAAFWPAVAILASLAAPAGGAAPIRLRDVTRESGVTFTHTDGSSGKKYIVETVASGMATFDYDGDGLVDIYFPNGRPLRGTKADVMPRNYLYRNLGGFRFADVTGKAGVGGAGYGMGVAIGDYDHDGRPDIYVSNFGPNVLYHNHGDGTFADVTARAGVARGDTIGAGVNFLDIDGDGNLDLFVSNYVRFTYENHVAPMMLGKPRYASPRDFPHQPNQLFRNNGDGTFREITEESGIGRHPGPGMGTVCLDYDNDGNTDVFVANDQSLNFLFKNDGAGEFEEVALQANVACNFSGEPVSGMGADAADYNHDGWLDLFMTDYQGEKPILFKNLGHGMFDDVAARTGVSAGSFPHVKWGCGFADFDNDGHTDILLVCGFLDDDIDALTDRTSYMLRPVLLRNTGDGKFLNVSPSAGDGMQVRVAGRGLALEDLDNDGRVDAVVLSARHPAVVLRNETDNGNHWFELQLRGVNTNRDGAGARLKVVAGDLVQHEEVHSGRGYQSHFGSRLHFGLGNRDRIDRIEVHWIGGGVDIVENVAADQIAALVEGIGLFPATLTAIDRPSGTSGLAPLGGNVQDQLAHEDAEQDRPVGQPGGAKPAQ